MNIAKRFLLLLITIIIMMGVCGCMETKNKDVLAEEIRTEALAYLNNSYSDTFTAKVFTASNWAYEYESITFTSEKYPDAIVEVRVYKNDDGTYRFKDNYFHCYMNDSAVTYGKAIVAEENAVVKVRFPNTVWSDELAGTQSFEEWKTQGAACADIFVITQNALSGDAQAEIAGKVAKDKVLGSVVFIVTNDENLLQDKTLDEILNNQSKFVVSKNDYYINSNFEIETN